MNAVKIDKKIVAFRLAKQPEEALSTAHEIEHIHEKVERPEKLLGSTYKVKTPLSDHALYITINDIVLNTGTDHEVRRPFEVFINSKNMDHFHWVVALTRVISAVFRKGGDCTFLVEELKAVFDPRGGYFKSGGRFMPSLVAEIGEVIESHLHSIGLLEQEEMHAVQKAILEEKKQTYQQSKAETSKDGEFPPSAQLCMKCYTKAVIVMDGCKTCLNCGNSKCG